MSSACLEYIQKRSSRLRKADYLSSLPDRRECIVNKEKNEVRNVNAILDVPAHIPLLRSAALIFALRNEQVAIRWWKWGCISMLQLN